MSNPWKSVAASRLQTGRFWTPDLSLDLMGRDWGRFEIGCYVRLSQSTSPETFVINTTTPKVHKPVLVHFPEDWVLDATFADFSYTIYIPVIAYNSGTPTDVGRLTLDNFDGVKGEDYDEVASDDLASSSGNRREDWIWRKYSGLPTGLQTFDLVSKRDSAGTTTIFVAGDWPLGTMREWPGGAARVLIDT